MTPAIVPADERHLEAILTIHNDAVRTTTAIWSEEPADLANRRALLDDRRRRGFPFLVAEDADRAVLGYASYGDFRAWPGYRDCVEHSVYVHRDHRGRGIARRLMEALIGAARDADLHVMVAGIEAGNAASIALHDRLGFTHAGTLREVGVKFGRRLDLNLMQLLLRA